MLQSKTTHVSSTTPFKIINDENDFALSAKSKTKALKSSVKPVIGGKVSFENSTPALGKGILKNGTQRKALSSLSTSQVNTRLNTPGVGMSQTSKQGFNMSVYNDEAKVKKSFRTASSNTREGGEKCFVPTMDDMQCSGATGLLDAYDEMISRSSNHLRVEPIVDCMVDGGIGALEKDLETLIAGFECDGIIDDESIFYTIEPAV